MTGPTFCVSINGEEPDLALKAAGAIFGLAMARIGASVSDLERGEIALGEIIETIQEVTPIAELTLTWVNNTFVLALAYDSAEAELFLDEGARQVIDAGLSDWTLGADAAHISPSSARVSSEYE